MTYLLDTSTFLWAAAQPAKLSRRALHICESQRVELVVSVASLWEIIIKCGTGAMRVANPDRNLPDWIARLGARVLTVQSSHAYAVHALPLVHRDPFDRLLVAQALTEDLPLVTADESIRKYHIRCVW